MADTILMHEDCNGCWSMIKSKWTPSRDQVVGGATAPLTKKTFSYIYMMSIEDVSAQGNYYTVDACLDSDTEACANDLIVYAVHKAEPYFYSLNDGFLGLSPSRGIANSSKMNFIQQMFDRGMIAKKQFGVHTQMLNSTDSPSEIRFGGYNKDLFKSGHAQQWIKTTGPMSWEVKISNADWHEDNIWQGKHALIDPGYPFIGLPANLFNDFESQLSLAMKAHPEIEFDCKRMDWC